MDEYFKNIFPVNISFVLSNYKIPYINTDGFLLLQKEYDKYQNTDFSDKGFTICLYEIWDHKKDIITYKINNISYPRSANSRYILENENYDYIKKFKDSNKENPNISIQFIAYIEL